MPANWKLRGVWFGHCDQWNQFYVNDGEKANEEIWLCFAL